MTECRIESWAAAGGFICRGFGLEVLEDTLNAVVVSPEWRCLDRGFMCRKRVYFHRNRKVRYLEVRCRTTLECRRMSGDNCDSRFVVDDHVFEARSHHGAGAAYLWPTSPVTAAAAARHHGLGWACGDGAGALRWADHLAQRRGRRDARLG